MSTKKQNKPTFKPQTVRGAILALLFLLPLIAPAEDIVLRDPRLVVVTNYSAPIFFCVTNEQTGEVVCAQDDQRVWVSTNFQFAFTAQSPSAYVIQQTDDLVQWTDTASLSNTSGEVVTNFPLAPKRFYRVRVAATNGVQ